MPNAEPRRVIPRLYDSARRGHYWGRDYVYAVQRQVRTLSAEGRLSAAILIVLPILVALYMMVVNYGYISLLWRSLIGLVMSASAVLLLVVGVLWMRRIVRIEV